MLLSSLWVVTGRSMRCVRSVPRARSGHARSLLRLQIHNTTDIKQEEAPLYTSTGSTSVPALRCGTALLAIGAQPSLLLGLYLGEYL